MREETVKHRKVEQNTLDYLVPRPYASAIASRGNQAELTAFLSDRGHKPASRRGLPVNSIIYIVGLVVVVVAVLSFFGLR